MKETNTRVYVRQPNFASDFKKVDIPPGRLLKM